MDPKKIEIPPDPRLSESSIDVLSLVEELACGRSVETLITAEYLFPLLAAEAVRQLQRIAANSTRISDASRQIAAHHGLIGQTLNDLVNLVIPSCSEELSATLAAVADYAASAFVEQAAADRKMIRQATMDFIFTTRDIVGIANMILKRVAIPKEPEESPEDPAP